MAAPSLSLFFLFGMFTSMIGSNLEPSSVLNIQDSITSLKQMVLQLQDRMSSLETTIPQTLQAANEEILITILDKMTNNSKNCATTNNDLRKELQGLLSIHSLHMDQNLRNQILEIKKLGKQMEDFQNRCTEEPPSIRNGRPVDFLRKHGSDVTYQCDRNFVVNVNSTVRCNFGKWEGQPPVCSLVTCAGEPPSPQHGRPADFERKHGSDVQYHCDQNFVQTINSTVRCNSGTWEGRPPVCTFIHDVFTLRAHHRWDGWSNHVSNVTCYSNGNSQKMEFIRVLDIGKGGALPTGARTYSQGKKTVLDFSSVDVKDKRGAFLCGFEMHGEYEGITFIIQRGGWFERQTVASIGDNASLGYGGPQHPAFRWFRDGVRVPAGDRLAQLTITGVRKEDAGIYEVYWEEQRQSTQRFFGLVVRGCPPNFFGKSCDQECPPCYNGGICEDQFGSCVCPLGFKGSSCEVACGENQVGLNCSESCDGGDCKGQMFCRPDPYGCSCAPGFHGRFCLKKCDVGTFGVDCMQTCHCTEGPCDPYTGACPEGCTPGWTGQSCQIPAGN